MKNGLLGNIFAARKVNNDLQVDLNNANAGMFVPLLYIMHRIARKM